MDTPDDLPPEASSDPFGPPAEPCECVCLHCQRLVDSDRMWYQRVVNGPPGSAGFWMCPTPNCSGAGFGMDLHPTDPDHPGNAGWSWCPDGDEEDEDGVADADADAEYDPDEPQYADELASPDDDVQGEEWKHGLQPGEPLPEPPEVAAARERWAAQQRKYDEPDRRPRTIDGSHWRRRDGPLPDGSGDETVCDDIREDDIPF